MLRKTFSLNGEWALRFCDAGEGVAANWPRTGVSGEGAYTAQVPGDVHLDLVRAGMIEEPLFEENAKQCEWMEEKDWWYSTEDARGVLEYGWGAFGTRDLHVLGCEQVVTTAPKSLTRSATC